MSSGARLSTFLAAASALLGAASGCASAASPADVASGAGDPLAFVEARRAVATIRNEARRERTENVSIRLSAPYLPSDLSARGAIAARPPDAMRMILLGP